MTVLPYHLWDVAERLARLAALRADHRAILDGVADDDPDVAVVLDPQRRAHDLATRDVERRAGDLEAFAALVADADAAIRREEAVRRLADLNDVHRDLLARVAGPADALGSDLPEPGDVQAVIDQAAKAIRAANEAGRSLCLPGEDPPLSYARRSPLPPASLQSPRIHPAPPARARSRDK
jgi:hypothetical protein